MIIDELLARITDRSGHLTLSEYQNNQLTEFLQTHELAVLSTVDGAGEVSGAVVNYVLGDDDSIYLLTKSETSKAHNMQAHNRVAMTIYDADQLKTVQLQGNSQIEADQVTKNRIFKKITQSRNYGGETMSPPITQIQASGFIVFKIVPVHTKFSDFRVGEISSE